MAVVTSRSAKPASVLEVPEVAELLRSILEQMRKQNAQLALVTGEELDTTDVPVEVM